MQHLLLEAGLPLWHRWPIALFANFLGPIGIVAGALISAGLGIMKLLAAAGKRVSLKAGECL